MDLTKKFVAFSIDSKMVLGTFGNITAIEDDAFGPENDASPDENDFYSDYAKFHYGVQIFIQYIFSPVVFASELFLLYMLLRFKQLRIRRNMYLLNCIYINVLTKILVIADLFMFKLETFDETSISLICLLIEYHNLQHPCYFVIVTLLALDSVLEHYIPGRLRNLEPYWLYFLFFIYSTFLIPFAVRGSKCFTSTIIIFHNRAYLIRYIIFPITVLTLLVLNIVQKICIKQSLTGLSVANIISYLHVPLFLYDVIVHFTTAHVIIIHFLYYTEFLVDMLSMSHPIFVIYFLCKRDQNFKMAFADCLKKCWKGTDNDTIEGIDNVAKTSLEDA